MKKSLPKSDPAPRTLFFRSFQDRVKAYLSGARRDFTLYVHFPCFDGVVSGALVTRFLTGQNRRISTIVPVNYNVRANWTDTRLQRPAAVVDFLYHPDASLWADHHSTAFVNSDPPANDPNKMTLYDPTEVSCSRLLWKKLLHVSDFQGFEGLRHWADKIDSARYADAREAVLGEHPALRINMGLALARPEDCAELVMAFATIQNIEKLAELPAVKRRYDLAKSDIKAGLRIFQKGAHIEDGVVQFDIETGGLLVSRYAPFLYYPDANYSVGIVRSKEHVRITAMRNPWKNFDSIHLGRIFGRYGGGGHQRVGAAVFTASDVDVLRIMREIVAQIRHQQPTSTINNQSVFA